MQKLAPVYRVALLALIAGMASGCSSTHPYASSTPENMTITTDVRSGTANLDVYSVEAPCKTNYEGTVDLSDAKLRIGVPANKLICLEFNFDGGNYFTGYRHTYYRMYLTPRAGYHYDTAVSYVDAMYGATIYEVDGHGGRRQLHYAEPPACAEKKETR